MAFPRTRRKHAKPGPFSLLMLFLLASCAGDVAIGGSESLLTINTGYIKPGTVPTRLSGELAVGAGGDVSYSIPLEVPPGRTGMTPDLMLSYSSAGGIGDFGAGFALSHGASVIRRCGQTLDLDGQSTSVHFDKIMDRLCLDGMRLVATNTTADYWDPNAEYRLAEDSFVRVRRTDGATHAFELTQRDGTRVLFGGPASTGATEMPQVGDRDADGLIIGNDTADLAWHAERIVDVSGNYIQYVYDDEVFADGAYEHRLVEIRYTGNDDASPSLNPERSVILHYEAREKTEDRFFAGAALRATRRVQAITMQVHGSTIREYQFNYELDAWDVADRLSSMRECDRFYVCRAPTNFTWSEPELLNTQRQVLDLPNQWDNGWWEQTMLSADLNGDGFDDLVYSELDDVSQYLELKVRLSEPGLPTSDPNYGGTTPGPSGPGPFFHDYVAPRHFGAPVDTGFRLYVEYYVAEQLWGGLAPMPAWFQVYDYDQDGQAELLVRQPVAGGSTHPEQWNLYGFDGGGLSLVQDRVLGCQNDNWAPFVPVVADLNGDGAADLLGSCATDNLEDPSDPVPLLDHRRVLYDWDVHPAGGFPLTDSSAGDQLLFGWNVTVDIDGDGQSEVISTPWYETDLVDWAPPTPAEGLVPVLPVGTDPGLLPAVHLPTAVDGDPQNYVFVDINGDGLRDAFTTDMEGGPMLRLNTGRGFGPAYSPLNNGGPTAGSPPEYAEDYYEFVSTAAIQVADFNHDGREDLLVPFSSCTVLPCPDGVTRPSRVVLHLSTGTHFRVLQLTSAGDVATGKGARYLQWSHFQIFDMNGDGQLEYSQVRDGALEVRSLKLAPVNQLIAVDDGRHNPEIEYYLANNSGCDESYPRACSGPSWAVARTDETVAESGNRETAYSFREAITDVRRRRWLGYASMIQVRDTLPVLTIDYDLQQLDFSPARRQLTPFAMLPVRTTRSLSGRSEETVYTNNVQPDLQANAFRVLQDEVRHHIDEDDGTTTNRLHDTIDDYTYDDWGTIKYHRTEDQITLETVSRNYQVENRVASFQIGLVKALYTSHAGYFGGTTLQSETRRTDFYYDSLGRRNIQVVEPGGGDDERLEIESHFDDYGNVYRIDATDSLGEQRSQHFEFDGDHTLLTRYINAVGHITDVYQDSGLGVILGTHAYDPADPSEELNQANQYDGFGRLLYRQRGDVGDTLTYTLDATNESLTVKSVFADGTETHQTYDSAGRLVKVDRRFGTQANEGNQLLFEYDVYDRRTLQTNWHRTESLASASETFQHDGWSRPTKHTNLVGAATEWVYTGRDVQITAPGNRVYNIDHDSAGRVTTRKEPLVDGTRSQVAYTYKPFGQLGTTTDVNGNVVETLYDGRDRLQNRIDPDSGTSVYQYNAFGDLTRQTNGASETRSLEYDLLGRLTEIDSSVDGVSTFTYDTAPGFGMGQVHEAITPNVNIAFQYDEQGRPSRVDQGSGGFKLYVEADYEAVTGRVSQVRMPSFGAPVTIDYIYAGYGETERVDFNGDPVWEALQRDDPLRRATMEMRGDLMQVDRNYDEQTHQLRSYKAYTPAETILDRGSYQYDDEGRLKQVIDVRENSLERYGYDARGRLTDWHRNATHVEYEYDAIGNQTMGAFGSRTYAAGSAGPHAMTAMGSATTTYDSAGRREANSKGWSADYTAFNLPTHVVNEDGDWRTFEYDAFNQRAVEERSDNTRIVRMGEALILTRTSPAKHSTITYPIQVEGERVAEITHQAYDGQFTHRFLNNDGVGSSLASSDGNGDRVAAPVVEPFGAVMNGSADSYQFATHDFDSQMNLVNANGRIYDPTSAAFLTPDPVRMPTQMGMNLYDYAAADPVNMYDPTGFFPQDDGPGGGGGWSTPWAQASTRFLGPVSGSSFVKPPTPSRTGVTRVQIVPSSRTTRGMMTPFVQAPLLTERLTLWPTGDSMDDVLDSPTLAPESSALTSLLEFGEDFTAGIESYASGIGTSLAHSFATDGWLGPEAERDAQRINIAIEAGVDFAFQHPDVVVDALWIQAKRRPGFIVGRGYMGALTSGALTPFIGIPLTLLSVHGSLVEGAQRGVHSTELLTYGIAGW